MRKPRGGVGHIIVPKGATVYPHELNVATILSWTGYDIEFITPTGHTHTPDIKYRGMEWEIKSPVGTSKRTIENNLRTALHQSSNIIIDLSRMRISEDKCLREVKRQNDLIKSKHRILVITKSKEIMSL